MLTWVSLSMCLERWIPIKTGTKPAATSNVRVGKKRENKSRIGCGGWLPGWLPAGGRCNAPRDQGKRTV